MWVQAIQHVIANQLDAQKADKHGASGKIMMIT